MSLQTYAIRKIGQNRGAPRLWLEGNEPARGGFLPGTRYNTHVDAERSLLTLEIVGDGTRIVSGKTRGEREIPIIDINSKELLAIFEGIEAVRVVVQEGRIHVLPVAAEVRATERLARLRGKLERGEPLNMGSISAGVGILDRAAHEGLELAGVATRLAFANEIREDCMDHAVRLNPAYAKDTILLTAPMQEVIFDEWTARQIPKVECLVGGIPCSGASNAGRAKRGLEHPEAHPEVGHLVVAFLAIIARVNPALVVLENVPGYASSASMSIIRIQLRDLGYELHETVLRAEEWNMLEHRDRMCMVAVTKGMNFSFEGLERPVRAERRLGEIMDDVPLDDPCWSRMQYLKDKQERDEAAGKGFRMNLVDAESTKVPTLNKTLARRQSTGTFIKHPENSDLLRLPTVREHARAKGVWEDLTEGATQTFGHEMLGQAVSVPPWRSLFKLVGFALQSFKRSSSTKVGPFVRADLIAA